LFRCRDARRAFGEQSAPCRPSSSRRLSRSISRLWSALWPLGENAGWSGELLSAEPVAGSPDKARVRLSWEGRDGRPIEKLLRLSEIVEGARFREQVEDDSSLDPAFWSQYSEEMVLEDAGAETRVTLTRTDRYRGLAFFIFRYFATRRELTRLKEWGETGATTRRFLLERPLAACCGPMSSRRDQSPSATPSRRGSDPPVRPPAPIATPFKPELISFALV
jgi:hypothetical protein